MPIGHARKIAVISSQSRVGRSCGLAALVLLLGNNGLQNAVAEGDTRTLTFHHTHRDDDLTITFKRDGRYDDDALKKLNHFLRDWRTDEQTNMDRRLFDVLWEVYRDVNGKQPIQIVSSYRSPQTNAMLRRRGHGVARFSQHMLGKAMDFYIPGVALEDIRIAGLRMQRGGVGYYPTSGSPFVHIDVGNVRHWPRMTHDQLARVFPDGRTVHIPSDGQPLSGYAHALADIERRGGSAGVQTASAEPEKPQRNFLQALLGLGKDSSSKDDEDDGDTTASTAPASPAPVARQKVAVAAIEIKPSSEQKTPVEQAKASAAKPAAAPTPARPAIVMAATRPNRPADAASLMHSAAPSASEVIAARGFWQETPDAAGPAPQTIAAAEPTTAASLPNWPATANASGDFASVPRRDAEPAAEAALGYSAPPEVQPALARPAPVGSRPMAAAGGAAMASLGPTGLTTVIKKTLAPLQAAYAAAHPAATSSARLLDRTDDPWMRAVMITPDVQNFMTVTVLGTPDVQLLTALMRKPSSAVMMTFGGDPNLGMATEQFSGDAVNFQSTVTFGNKTAMLD